MKLIDLILIFCLYQSHLPAMELGDIWMKKQQDLSAFESEGDFGITVFPNEQNGQRFVLEGNFRWIVRDEKYFADIKVTKKDLTRIAAADVPYRVTIVGDAKSIATCGFNKNHSKGCEVEVYPPGNDVYKAKLFVWFDVHRGLELFFPNIVPIKLLSNYQSISTNLPLTYDNGLVEGVVVLNSSSLMKTFESKTKTGNYRNLIAYEFSDEGFPISYKEESFEGTRKTEERTLVFKRFEKKLSNLSFAFSDLESCDSSRLVEHDVEGPLFMAIPNAIRKQDMPVDSVVERYREAAINSREQRKKIVDRQFSPTWVIVGIGCIVIGIVIFLSKRK